MEEKKDFVCVIIHVHAHIRVWCFSLGFGIYNLIPFIFPIKKK